MVFTRRRTVVFIHGCFWHSHGCRRSGAPKTNGEYWKEKLAKNAERDAKNSAYYAAHGWKVITVWECEIRSDLFGALNGMVEDLGPA
jgi:DNA mismatch endonuclease (patch repair protein)